MKFRIIALLIILSLIVPAISITGTAQVYADDEQQPTEEQSVIDPVLEYYLTRSPETPICLIVMLKSDPNIGQEINNIRQKYDPQYYDQYCAMNDDIDSFLNQKYGKIQEHAIEKIQELPGTTSLKSYLRNNSLLVVTRVDNIRTIATVPNVVKVNFCGPGYDMGDLSPVKRLYPHNGMLGVPIQPTFSWIPLKDVTKYRLVLSSDPGMAEIIIEAEVPTAKYVYEGILKYSTNYFWKVLAVEPEPIEWSGVWSFQTEQQPTEEQSVIGPGLEKYLSSLSPTDNMSLYVVIKIDPKYHRALYTIRNTSLKLERDIRSIRVDMWVKYRAEIVVDATVFMSEILCYFRDELAKIVRYVGEQRNSEVEKSVKKRIEQLPDTGVVVSYLSLSSSQILVKTKVSNVKDIASMPDVVDIHLVDIDHVASRPAWYYGPQLLVPPDGCLGCPLQPAYFFWLPYKDATKYKFLLARNPSMSDLVIEAEVTGTSYEYDGELEYGSPYFWRVMALESAPSDWSATFSFQTELAPLQLEPWSPIMMIILMINILVIAVMYIIGFATWIGFASWFFVARRHRAK